jgi:hypothetical protein
MADTPIEVAARAERVARHVLADPTIPNALRQKGRELLAKADVIRILHGALDRPVASDAPLAEHEPPAPTAQGYHAGE